MKKFIVFILCFILNGSVYSGFGKSFNGSNDFVDMNYLISQDNFAFDFWAKWTGTTFTTFMGSVNVGGGPFMTMTIDRDPDFSDGPGNISIRMRDSSGNDRGRVVDGNGYNDETWRHFFFNIIDATAGDMDIYVNGVQSDNADHGSGAPNMDGDVTNDFYLGARHNGGNDDSHANMEIFNMRIYTKSLTESQIQVSVRCINQPIDSLDHQQLLFADGDVYEDLSINGNDGTCSACPDNSVFGPIVAWCSE